MGAILAPFAPSSQHSVLLRRSVLVLVLGKPASEWGGRVRPDSSLRERQCQFTVTVRVTRVNAPVSVLRAQTEKVREPAASVTPAANPVLA